MSIATPNFMPKTTQRVLLMMSDLFKAIYTEATDNNQPKNIILVPVPLRVTTTSKIISWWRSPSDKVKIMDPLLSLGVQSMAFDPDRASPPTHQLRSSDAAWNYAPVPFNYTIELGIFSKKVSTLFDIIEQIIVSYRTMRLYPLVEFQFTNGQQIVRDVPVILDSTAFTIQEEMQYGDEQLFYASLNFTIKTFTYRQFILPSYNFIKGEKDSRVTQKTNWDGSTTNIPGDAFFIENIDIKFEDMQSQKFAELLLTTETGGTVNTTVIDPS